MSLRNKSYALIGFTDNHSREGSILTPFNTKDHSPNAHCEGIVIGVPDTFISEMLVARSRSAVPEGASYVHDIEGSHESTYFMEYHHGISVGDTVRTLWQSSTSDLVLKRDGGLLHMYVHSGDILWTQRDGKLANLLLDGVMIRRIPVRKSPSGLILSAFQDPFEANIGQVVHVGIDIGKRGFNIRTGDVIRFQGGGQWHTMPDGSHLEFIHHELIIGDDTAMWTNDELERRFA